MIRINLVEDCVSIRREPATQKEIMEATLVMFFVTAAFSILFLFILNGLASIFSD